MLKFWKLKKPAIILLILLIVCLIFWIKKCNLPVYGYYCQQEGELPSSFRSSFLHSSALKGSAFFWYQCLDDGEIIDSEETDLDMLRYLQSKGVETYAVVHNLSGGQFDRSVVEEILTSGLVSTKLISNIIRIVVEQGFTGVNLDLENIPPELRDSLSDFVARLKKKLERENKRLLIALPAKLKDDLHNQWSGAFDYRALARAADRLVLMAYEQHGAATGPGPIASLSWVEKVIKYSLEQIPAEKLILGIPVYGFLWASNNSPPQYLSYSQVKKISKKQGTKLKWDSFSKVPYLTYEDEDVVYSAWFENKKSFSYKLKLAKKYNLGGIALWRLGLEDPSLWDHLR